MSHTIKIAISLPKREYQEMEKRRHKLGATRSGVIRSALSHWFHCLEDRKKILRYQEGYRELPEGTEEWVALERVQSTVLSPEDWS